MNVLLGLRTNQIFGQDAILFATQRKKRIFDSGVARSCTRNGGHLLENCVEKTKSNQRQKINDKCHQVVNLTPWTEIHSESFKNRSTRVGLEFGLFNGRAVVNCHEP